MALDPYAPPDATIGAAPLAEAGAVRREGRILVVPVGGGETLPDHCLRCGAPAGGQRLVRKLYWHPPWVYALLLFNVVFYVLGSLFTRRTMTVAIPLCDVHRGGRRNRLLASAAVIGLTIAVSCAGLASDADEHLWLVFLAGFIGLGALILLLMALSPLRAMRIDKVEGRFAGAGEAFLDRLPRGP